METAAETMTCTLFDEDRSNHVQPKPAHLARLIGNTHLVGIEFSYFGRARVIYAKCMPYFFGASRLMAGTFWSRTSLLKS